MKNHQVNKILKKTIPIENQFSGKYFAPNFDPEMIERSIDEDKIVKVVERECHVSNLHLLSSLSFMIAEEKGKVYLSVFAEYDPEGKLFDEVLYVPLEDMVPNFSYGDGEFDDEEPEDLKKAFSKTIDRVNNLRKKKACR